MATFHDIAGWREELTLLQATKRYKEKFCYTSVGPSPKIPLSNIVQFAELLLYHQELHEAVLEMEKFWARTPRFKVPRDAEQMLNDFGLWYMIKADVGPNYTAFMIYGQRLAGWVAIGRFPRVDHSTTMAELRRQPSYAMYIAAD